MKLATERLLESRRPASGKIMLVGGYGEVGKLAGRLLARRYPNRVIIAGRREQQAWKAAEGAGHGTEARRLDLDSEIPAEALDGVGIVLVCLDQTDPSFVKRCLASGIHYLDVSTQYGFLKRVEELGAIAEESGAAALLSVGFAPGLTNLMAAQAARMFDEVDRIDIFVRLGLAETHGAAAIEWMLDSLDAAYPVYEDGHLRCVRSFGASRSIQFPNESRKRWAHRFAFSDQITLGSSLRARSVSTWLCFESRVVTALFAIIARSRLARLLHRDPWRRWAVNLLRRVRYGSGGIMASVRASGKVTKRRSVVELDVGGLSEALTTALIAEHAVRFVADREPPAGVHHIDQVMQLADVIPAMQTQDLGFFANAVSRPSNARAIGEDEGLTSCEHPHLGAV